jgi:biopolymer transport protein ExbD
VNLNRKKKTFIIPMNSMSDVAFLLLIFIMLVALINYRKEVHIDYVRSENAAKKLTAEKNMEIWVDKAGNTYLDGTLCDYKTIESAIVDVFKEAPDTRVQILADKDTQFEKVNSILEILQLLQYRVVGFVVKDYSEG